LIYELKDIIHKAKTDQQSGLKSVLASVVFLEGSSYRKPGVRMLISENGEMTGAVSGGCVEAEVKRRAQSVFETGKAKMMTYDGRYRLGCEGILYILIEPFVVSEEFIEAFQHSVEARESLIIDSNYLKEDNAVGAFGSSVKFKDGSRFSFSDQLDFNESTDLQGFTQTLKPNTRLLIIGAEHDAVKLCHMASSLGWEVDVITSIKDPKELSDFPGARSVSAQSPEMVDIQLDQETVIVLMTHNYALDLKYLVKFASFKLKYLGILGSSKRRNQLQNDLLEYKADLEEDFLEAIYSPAGLSIGAITPEEIALSILSEILSVTRNTEPSSLRIISGKIHLS